MSQTGNLITLRKNKLNLHLVNANSKSFLCGFYFSNTLKYLLNKKDILMTSITLNYYNNVSYIFLDLFYKTKKITFYKNKTNLKKKQENKFKAKKQTFASLISKQFKILKNSLTIFKIRNLNRYISLKNSKNYYNFTKRFLNVLFVRRFNLFIDFIKLTVLFGEKKIKSKFYILILGQIFKVLPKRKHNIFIFFFKSLFTKLIIEKKIKGVKFVINGKLSGKPRSSTSKISIGNIPIQTISANIEFSKLHIYTLYGVFGFKMWIHY